MEEGEYEVVYYHCMRDWIVPAFSAFSLYGLWVFYVKLASGYIDPRLVLFYEALAALFISVIAILFSGIGFHWDVKGSSFAIISGIVGGTGGIFFYLALKRGNASVVTPLVGLYPLVAILLSFLLLHETITMRQGVGIIFALTAMVLIAG